MTTDIEESHGHDDFGGLDRDLPRLLDRRGALRMLGGAGVGVGVLAVTACGTSLGKATTTTTAAAASGSSASTIVSGSDAGTGSASCATIPNETAGPFPGDGTNGPDVLTQSGVVRQDITTSFGSMSGTAKGIPLTVRMKMLDTAKGCTPFVGSAMYLWHCDRDGGYSLYSQGVTNQNYLRGVQETDADGWITFTTIFPGCYSGRWPHIHFEVYPSLAQANNVTNRVATSQLALPQDVCEVVYVTSGYESSVRNLAQTSLQRDNVFSDGWTTQLATVTGDVTNGFVSQLNVPV